MSNKLDILAFAAHPDDAELSCSGTLILHKRMGRKTGVVDLTRGELGTKGSPELRQSEAAVASRIMKLDARENLGLRDGFFGNNEESQRKVITAIRKYRPEIILANAISDRHSDHGRAAELVRDAAFLSGLVKIETHDENGAVQEPWRAKLILHYIQDFVMVPDLVVDVTEVWEEKMESVRAYGSQFVSAKGEVVTPISVAHFLEYIGGRAMDIGRFTGVKYGEGFVKAKPVGVKDLTSLY